MLISQIKIRRHARRQEISLQSTSYRNNDVDVKQKNTFIYFFFFFLEETFSINNIE